VPLILKKEEKKGSIASLKKEGRASDMKGDAFGNIPHSLITRKEQFCPASTVGRGASLEGRVGSGGKGNVIFSL